MSSQYRPASKDPKNYRNLSGAGPTRVHKPKALDKDVYALALERMAYVLDTHDRAIVAFSGGKDSTAVLNVALEVLNSDRVRWARHLPLRVVHFDEEAIPLETEEYVRRVHQREDVALEWYCMPVRHRNASSRRHPYWWPWAPEARDKWCRPLPTEALTHIPGFPVDPPEARLTIPATNGLLAPGRHRTAMLMGIRAEESLTRHQAVSQRKVDNYIIPYNHEGWSNGNINKVYPIYDWRTSDIWTATALHNWDYNQAYDLMEMRGMRAHTQRCSPAFGEEPLRGIRMFAECFPDVWDRMCERVPGIGAAYRYANTELYGFKDLPPRPEGVPWPDFLAHYVQQWGPDEASTISHRIRRLMELHYRHIDAPILDSIASPVNGIRWKFLLPIVMRGDLKHRRKEAAALPRPDEHDKWVAHWHKYADAIQELKTSGVHPSEYGHPRPWPADPYALIPKEYRR